MFFETTLTVERIESTKSAGFWPDEPILLGERATDPHVLRAEIGVAEIVLDRTDYRQ